MLGAVTGVCRLIATGLVVIWLQELELFFADSTDPETRMAEMVQ